LLLVSLTLRLNYKLQAPFHGVKKKIGKNWGGEIFAEILPLLRVFVDYIEFLA